MNWFLSLLAFSAGTDLGSNKACGIPTKITHMIFRLIFNIETHSFQAATKQTPNSWTVLMFINREHLIRFLFRCNFCAFFKHYIFELFENWCLSASLMLMSSKYLVTEMTDCKLTKACESRVENRQFLMENLWESWAWILYPCSMCTFVWALKSSITMGSGINFF